MTEFKKIEYKGNILILKEPLFVDVKKEADYYVLQYPELNIYLVGKDIESVCLGFQEDFIFLCEDYAQASDDELTPKAQELKQRLLSIVER